MTNNLTPEQIEHMVDRFLRWKLPENFRPDAGISFKPDFNENTPWPNKHKPSGTNLFDCNQATEMVKFMIEDLPALPNQSEQINALVENAKSQTETNLAIIRKLDAKDQRIATLEEALINATELIEQLHYEHLLGMEWLEDEENKYRAIAGGQDNE